MDFAGVIEEIALEGLEGITLEALWKRLEDRPGFVEGKIDKDTQCYIWSLVTRHDALQFFVLPHPRPELTIFKYNEYVPKGSVQCTLPAKIPEDIYSRQGVAKNGVMGCCEHFETRRDITMQIRGTEQAESISLDDAIEKWGQTLVIVASQRCRNLVLLQTCEMMTPMEFYCFLELIGRARYDGEITFCRSRRGLCNPLNKKFSLPSNTFSRLDGLVSLGLVTKQSFILTYEKPHWVNHVRIVHLRKFYTQAQANHIALFSPVADLLSKVPNKTMPFYTAMRQTDMKPEAFLRTNKRISHCFSISNASRKRFVEQDAEADAQSIVDEKALTGMVNPIKIKLITLRKPLEGSAKMFDEDDDENGDEESFLEDCDDAQGKDETTGDSETFFPSVDDSILHQAVSIIYKSGTNGIHLAGIKKRLNLSRINMKYLAKELKSLKCVGTVKKFFGKQKAEVWMRPDLAEEQNILATEEKKKVSTEEEVDQTELSAAETETAAPQEEPEINISPEEEAEMTAWLEKIKVKCTIERSEMAQSSSENDDPVKTARKKLILDKLKAKKIYCSRGEMYQDILKAEKEKGWTMRVCRKSVKRILISLYNDKHVEYLNVHLPDHDGVRQMIVLPGSGLNNPLIKKAVVEYANAVLKFKENHLPANMVNDDPTGLSAVDKNFTRYTAVADLSLISVFKKLTRGLETTPRKLPPGKKSSSSITKMGRVESFHEYLHYMLYGYAGITDREPEVKDVLEGIEQPLPVYLDVDDWRRYLPPLLLHNVTALKSLNALPGSCMIGDLILNIPLGKIWNLINRPKDLEEILGKDIEDKVNVPLCQTPKHILIEMACRKRFMPRLTEDLILLCHQGLLSFGPKQRCNNMEFGSIYLHKQATLLDTRFSLPGYLKTKKPDGEDFPVLQYNLNTREELAQYWNDLRIISLTTNLGLRKINDVPGDHGDISILDAVKPTSFKEIKKREESLWLPGDRRGVAGLDSSLMTHMTRNWGHGVLQPQGSQRLKELTLPVPGNGEKSEEKKQEQEASAVKSKPAGKKKKVGVVTTKKKGPKRLKKKKAMKVKLPGAKKHVDGRTLYLSNFDAKDHMAIRRMRRIRSYFSPMENGMLLLFQLASHLLNPKYPLVPTSTMRDILHESLPESVDKTTPAIKAKSSLLFRDPSFKLHMAVYLAQAKNDEALLNKYCAKSVPQNSPEAIKLYRELVKDLKETFRNTRGVSLPESMAHLNQNYTVQHTMNLFDGLKSWSQPLDTLSDIRTMVCADFLETFLYIENPVSSVPVYYAFSKFEEPELKKAYDHLKSRDILVMIKSIEREQKRLVTNPSVLNNYKSKRVHNEAIKSLYPQEIFLNIGTAIKKLLDKQSASPSKTGSNVCQADNGDKATDPCSHKHGCAERLVELAVEELQGGVSLATLCLAAVDELSMGINLPAECVSLDRCGQRKIGLDQPEIFRKRPVTLEKDQDGKRIPKKRRMDCEDEDQKKESATVRRVSRKFATTESPLTANAKISLQQQQRLLARQQQAMAKSQDRQMKDVEEDVNNEAGPSGSANLLPLTKETTAMDCAENVSLVIPTSGNSCSIQSDATGHEHISAPGGSSLSTSSSRRSLSVVSLPSVKMTIHHSNFSNLGQDGANYLPNFVAWVASSCLMTLARTSYIHRLNLMVADCSLNRHFSLVTMKTIFGFKRKLNPTLSSKRALPHSSEGESTIQNSSKSSETDAPVQDNNGLSTCTYGDGGEASKSGQGQTAPPAQITQPAEHNLKITEENSQGPENLSSPKSDGPRTETENVPCRSKILSSFGESEPYRDLFSRLEIVFLPSELENDLTEAELSSLLPSTLVEKGLRLYSLLDAAGEFGMDERDVQKQLSLSWVSLQEIENSLVRGKAVLKAGFSWSRLVSRRHFRPWLVEVSETAGDMLSISEGGSEDQDGVKRPSRQAPPQSVFYQVRHWRHFLGGRLDVAGLRRVLERALTEIMIKPGQVVSALCRQLNPHFLPTTTLDALQILEELGCVCSVFLPAKRQIEMFGKTSRCARIPCSHDSDADSIRTIDINVDAPLRLASFIQAAQYYCQEARTL